MPEIVFIVIIFAAVLHASWNAVVRAGKNKYLTMALVTTSAAIWALILLPFFSIPKSESWLYIAISALLQICYFYLISKTYNISDMSQTYPLMRGTAPFIVAVLSALILGDKISKTAWVGIIIISSGILFMLFTARKKSLKGIIFALLNAVVIAGYTLVDGVGVRLSESPVAYTLWIFLLTGLGIIVRATLTQWIEIRQYIRTNWHLGIIGGIGTVASYGLALWGMTLAPVAVVAALRETSILFATLISALILKEKVDFIRIISACIIVIGAIVLRLS